MSKLRIAEIFHSIQGEGIWMGTPSVFVRVSGCNLRCVWCDTPYASWSPEGPLVGLEEIIERVGTYGCDHVVLTGGEPMLFDPIEKLAAELKTCGHTITIETAGTIYRDLPCDLMSISPKLANSTPDGAAWRIRHEETRINFEALTRLVRTFNHQVKFVVADPQRDISEVEAVLARLPEIEKDRVLLMPEGIDTATISRGLQRLAPIALEKDWRLCPRLHLELFGNVRGT